MTEISSKKQNEKQNELQENLLMWIIRYVLIPLVLASIAGFFALEVVKMSAQYETNEDPPSGIFVTMTATATTAQPTPSLGPTGTAVPNQTEEAHQDGTETSQTTPNPATPVPPVGCPQVPFGWQLYTVQPGNTLFSLARQTGTTVAMIQQVNCLYGTLKAYEQIWLPAIVSKPIEVTAVVEETAVVDPIITETPTITVTEPVGLPDLINSPGSLPNISVSCPNGPGTCVTSVNLAVSNVGLADADLFNIQVWLDPAQSVVLNQVVERLMPGESVSFSLLSPPGGNCYDPNCTVCVTVDSRDGVLEEDETNNQFCTTFPG